MEVIAQGAEAVLKSDNNRVLKQRIPKSYRHPEIDERLRKLRTRKEAKVIQKINSLVPSPKLISVDEANMEIVMELVHGEKLRDVLEKSDYKEICNVIGKQIAVLHKNNIMHGDLTTSNMILSNGKIVFIDFGLSFDSTKVEDRAVDLYLLKQALNSKHYSIPDAFSYVLKGYNADDEILKRLKLVESRGRNKHK
ncbi:Kae1-associated serine/threonine protein kinase [Candidatus Woesearchaeota archaeon]|nr:Kae1-associated serine/threonine protein kinase [Candidatus Woesearchaeota archaeon]